MMLIIVPANVVILENLITFLLNQSILLSLAFLMILAFFKKKKRKRKKTNMYNADSEVYNDLLQTYLI